MSKMQCTWNIESMNQEKSTRFIAKQVIRTTTEFSR